MDYAGSSPAPGTKYNDNMKKLISENNGYKVWVELTDLNYPTGMTHIKFLTTYDDAKDPTFENVKFSMSLNDNELKILKDLL